MIVLNFLVICLDLTGILSCGQEGRLYLNTNSTKSCRVARMRLYNFGNDRLCVQAEIRRTHVILRAEVWRVQFENQLFC